MALNQKIYPDKNYYDITISNLDSGTTIPPLLYFNESRTQPFIDKPEDYYLSIIRFSIDTGTILPVFIPEIQRNQPDINLTVYSVSLQYTDPFLGPLSVQTFIEWRPQNLVSPLPPAPNENIYGIQYNGAGYYDCFQYQFFLNLVNEAFQTCFDDLNALVDLSPLTTHAPIMTFDIQNKIFILNCDVDGYSSTLPRPIQIFMNASLYQLFGTLPITINSVSGKDNQGNSKGLIYQIQTDTFGGASLTTFPPDAPDQYTAIQVQQETSSIPVWSPVVAIVFCSTTLPVVANQVSAPLIYDNGRTIQFSNNSNIAPIITDIVADNALYTPFLVYNPLAEYRLISLVGNSPLNNIDIQVYWRNRFGELNALRLPSGGSCTLKILFTRKNTTQTK